VRPVTYYLPIALAIGLFLALGKSSPGLRWKAPAVLLLSVLPWLAAWQIRNRIETGFGGFSSIEAHNLYFFSAGDVTARVDHRSLAQVGAGLGYDTVDLFVARHPGTASWNQAQRLQFMQSDAERVLRAHPWLFLRAHVEGMFRTALNPGAAVLLSMLGAPVDNATFVREQDEGLVSSALEAARRYPGQTVTMAALEVVLLGTYVFAILGAVRWRGPAISIWLLLGVALYFIAVSGGVVGEARFRLPVMPELCIVAAAGIVRLPHVSRAAEVCAP
jgi:hypothetical protein